MRYGSGREVASRNTALPTPRAGWLTQRAGTPISRSLPPLQHPLQQSGCWRRQPGVLRDDKGRVVDLPGIATRTIAQTPRTGLLFTLPAPAAPGPGLAPL